jgi:hypothetical protein
LRVGSHELIPVELGTGGRATHLTQRAAPGEEATEWASRSHGLGAGELRSDMPAAPVWRTRTLCGRPLSHGILVADLSVDLLDDPWGLLCKSCWRIVEGWLSPPPPGDGEDEIVAWIIRTVLTSGEAMVEDVPAPRLESLRRRVRSELKQAIGGSVRTTSVGTALIVDSLLVLDAKTPERLQAELRAAADRVSALEEGHAVEPPKWRRRWREIVGNGQ